MKKKTLKALIISAMLFMPMTVLAQNDVDGVTSATQSSAQRENRQRPRRAQFTVDSLNAYMKANLSLTETQQQQVETLNKKYSVIIEGPQARGGKGLRPPRGGNGNGRPSGPPPSGMRPGQGADSTSRPNPFAEMKTKQTEYETELHKILNDSQYAAYEKIKPKFASQRKPKGRPNRQDGKQSN